MDEVSKNGGVYVGNAQRDATRGWFVGHFVDETLGLRHSDEVELKWGVHKAGDERAEWVTGEKRKTVAVLVSGKWELIFRDKSVVLKRPGDYCIWGDGTDHRWRGLADSVVLTVRWPSASI